MGSQLELLQQRPRRTTARQSDYAVSSMRLVACAALLASAVWTCLAIDIQGSIVSTGAQSVLPLASDSKVLLDGGSAGRAFIRADGQFKIRNVQAGSYLLSVLDREYSFPSLSITVLPNADSDNSPQSVQVRPHTIGRIPGDPATIPLLSYPLQIKPVTKLDYYDVKKAFSVTGLIMQNKMILFMVIGIGFAVGMPKLLALVDPETLKEVQANQAEMHRNLGSVQNMDVAGSLSKMLAGGGNDKAAASGTSSPANAANARRRK